MGKGIALEFRKRYPRMFEEYVELCKEKKLVLGEPYVWRPKQPGLLEKRWVLNFPTKRHWRSRSELWAIRAGLHFLQAHYHEWGIESLAVPPLGCGHGGLRWPEVGPILRNHFGEYDIPVELFSPAGASQGVEVPE